MVYLKHHVITGQEYCLSNSHGYRDIIGEYEQAEL
jgi:hypothetical protein